MAHRRFLLVLLVAPALAFACGGKTTGSADGGPGSSSSSGGVTGSSSGGGSGGVTGSSSGGEPVVCMSTGMGGSSGGLTDGGPPPCETSASETCSDGNTYNVNCECPGATCICSVTSSSGGSGGDVVPYPGCPSCTGLSQLFSLCGFPQ